MKKEYLDRPITSFVCFDIETTGLSPITDKVIEIGAVKVKDKKVVEQFSELINPQEKLPALITKLTGIDDGILRDADSEENVIKRFLDFAGDYVVLGHNVMFDFSFIKTGARRIGLNFEKKGIDTLELSRKLHHDLESRSLENMCIYYQINNMHAHRALDDAKATVMLYVKLCNDFFEENREVFLPKQLNYKIKKNQPMTIRQKNYLIDLLKYHNIEYVQPIDTLTKSEASKWIDQIILNNGRMN